MGVTSTRIAAVARSSGARTVADVMDHTGAGGGCGTCHPEIHEILADLAGQPVDEATRRDNRITCRDASFQKIEAAVCQSIQAGLRETEIEIVSVEGLRIDLHLHGADDAQIRARIADRLRKLVCAELDVVFG